MLTFKVVRWKNLLSYGNAFTEIPLNTSNTNLLVGKNGSGKSIFLDAISFALFGKPFRKIVKGSLVNSVNYKECVVEIEFSSNGKEYKIIRGIRPNVFQIFCDDTLLNQDSAKDYQAYLEKFILKMSFKTFTQIVVLGSATYTTFMELTAADRRAIIENLLDIQIFSVMNVLAKQKLLASKTALENNRIALNGKEDKKSFIQKNIASLEQNNQTILSELKEKLVFLDREIQAIEGDISGQETVKQSLLKETGKIDSLNKKHRSYISIQSSIKAKRAQHGDHIAFYGENDDCPICKQNIDTLFKEQIVKETSDKIIEFSDALEKIDVAISDLINEINQIQVMIRKINEIEKEISSFKSSISSLRSQKRDVEERIKKIETADKLLLDNQQELKLVEGDIISLQKEKEDILDERMYIDGAIALLKDDGIKTQIIKKYLPIINRSINKYLRTMEFGVDFHINEQFEETIKSRYRDDFRFASFSEGEKARINLALLFTWRALAKRRNSCNTNLLIMDEVCDSSMDAEGIDAVMNIIGAQKNTNIFVISHRDQMIDKFDKSYVIEKKGNFSAIKT